MALSENTKEILLTNLYYSPETQFTSIKSLYDAVKNKKVYSKRGKTIYLKTRIKLTF